MFHLRLLATSYYLVQNNAAATDEAREEEEKKKVLKKRKNVKVPIHQSECNSKPADIKLQQ